MALPNLSSLADLLAGYDFQANRIRTTHAQNLHDLTDQGVKRRASLADSFADRGLAHSGINMKSQTELGTMLDKAQSQLNQAMEDRLADIARKKIAAQTGFNISSLMPR